jgi:hypothetical protein
MSKSKEDRKRVADIVADALEITFGPLAVKRDGDSYIRVRFADDKLSAPRYIRVDIRMEP